MAAALALQAARAGKCVLGIDVDAKGDLGAALGKVHRGFQPRRVHSTISVLALHREDSLQEYLHIFFKVPKMTRMTPLARVFDFIATGVPGPRDMLVIGKVAFEERRRDAGGSPAWDLIIVDASATGHVVSQLNAPRAMAKLVRSGVIRNQVEWIDATLRDSERTAVVTCCLPEEMPVVETIELHEALRTQTETNVALCVLNRTMPVRVDTREHELVAAMSSKAHLAAVNAQVDGDVSAVAEGLLLAERLGRLGEAQGSLLRKGIDTPVAEVPLLVRKPGLATSRAVGEILAETLQ